MTEYNILHTGKPQSGKEGPVLVKDSVLETKKLLSGFNGFINRVSSTYHLLTGIEKSEFFGEANLALLKAHQDFDSTRSDSFEPYAKFIIVDAMNEYIRQNKVIVTIPRYIARANRIIVRIKKNLGKDETHFASVIAGTFKHESVEEVEKDVELLKAAADRAGTDLKALVEKSEFLPLESDDSEIAEEFPTMEDEQSKMVAKLFVEQIRKHLTDDELVISDYLMDGFTINQIGEKLDVSHNWVTRRVARMRKKVLTLLD